MKLLKVLAAILVIVNSTRIYIVIWGWSKLERLPEFKDGYTIHKPILFDWRTDEWLLVFAHFLTPIFIFLMLIIIVKKVVQKKRKLIEVPIIISLIIILIEIILRSSDAYSYVMYD